MGMFDTPKAFASLSSGLLARKGAAKPAMRPQGFGQTGASLEDLGWNDMGFEAPKPTVSAQARDADHDAFGDSFAEAPLRNPVAALTPSPVHNQQAEIAARFAAADDEEPEGQEDDEDTDFGVPEGTLVEAPRWTEEEVPEAVAEAPVAVLSLKPAAVAVAPVLTLAPPPAPKIAEPRAAEPRAAAASGPKAAFTLRLDAARHLRLRLACALTGRSAQMLVTEAVDKLLLDYPELETFAGTLPAPTGRHTSGRRTKG